MPEKSNGSSLGETKKYSSKERSELAKKSAATGRSELHIATQEQIAEREQKMTAIEKKLSNKRLTMQLNAAMRNAAALHESSALQRESMRTGDDDALIVQNKLITELLDHAPIIVPRQLDTVDVGNEFAASMGAPQTDNPFPDGFVPEEFGQRLVPQHDRESLADKPRVLVLRFDQGKFSVRALSLVDLMVSQIRQGLVAPGDLDKEAIAKFDAADRAAIQSAAPKSQQEPGKQA